jgi:hypothetical protein
MHYFKNITPRISGERVASVCRNFFLGEISAASVAAHARKNFTGEKCLKTKKKRKKLGAPH